LGDGSDRFPFYDLEPDEDTISRWHGEGFPEDTSFSEYFNLESHHSIGLTLRSSPFFRMAPDLLHDPSYFDRHYNPDDPKRYVKDLVNYSEHLEKEGRVVYVDASGGGLLQMLGVGDWQSFVSACFALVKRAEFVEDLVNRTTDFYCVCLERVLSKVSVDYASFYEPIASNTGPVISPAMFERFAIPGYKKVIGLLEKFNVPLRIFCTTGGNLTPLLPSLIDAGINCLWISNIMSAGMEYDKLRRTYGTDVALIGGIDSTALSRDEAAIRSAVEKTVPSLLESGHYLPCLDDRPRSNIPLVHYQFFRQILEEMALKG
jgi:uroporphyrinogen decarboxylase-like protein